MELTGRRVIYTDYEDITEANVLEVLSHAMPVHLQNRTEIQYLYDYYRGKQPVLRREKEFRPEINNKIVENRANEIVSFKVGYLMGEPVQYVSRSSADTSDKLTAINTLNEYVFAEDKATKDKELADWFHICGTAYRLVLPDPTGEEDEAPFEIYTLDPRNSFVVYHTGLGNKPVMGVVYSVKTTGACVYSIYTRNRYFEIEYDGYPAGEIPYTGKFLRNEEHIYNDVPIIEYPANSARLGAFEIVITLLDAMNTVASNRVDGVEQFIQALLVLKGMTLSDEAVASLKTSLGLSLPEGADAYYITQELNQTQTQTLIDDMYQTILVICGMPNRNGNGSTSDTGSAVIMRDGWSDAEARAKDSELMFKRSEKRFLRLALEFSDTYRDLGLKVSDIEIRFTRRNYENITAKANVLTMLLANEKIYPKLAFEHCGLFVDPDLAYTQSEEYAAKRREEEKLDLSQFAAEQTLQGQITAKADEDE